MSHTVRFKLSNEEARVVQVVINSLRKQGHEVSLEKFARQCTLAAVNEIFRSAKEMEEAKNETNNAPE